MANVSFLRKSTDGKWLRCPQCSRAYWGAFRPTDFVKAKFDAHTTKAHKPEAGVAAGAEAPAKLPAKPAKAAAKPRKPAAAKVAKIAAKAQAKGDGEVRIVREAGPNTAELMGAEIADALADIQAELNPRLQLGQGPRNFSDAGNNRFEGPRKARDANKGQDVVARVQAQLSPLPSQIGRRVA